MQLLAFSVAADCCTAGFDCTYAPDKDARTSTIGPDVQLSNTLKYVVKKMGPRRNSPIISIPVGRKAAKTHVLLPAHLRRPRHTYSCCNDDLTSATTDRQSVTVD